MKVTLNWLKQCVDFNWSPAELTERLTMLGLEVEGGSTLGGEFAGIAASAIRFHAPFGFQLNGLGWSLNLFAWLCLPWLKLEVTTFRDRPPPVWLEKAGSASYSPYLFHVIGMALASTWLGAEVAPGWRWAMGLFAILLGSGLFFFLVERPTHRIARIAGKYFAYSR